MKKRAHIIVQNLEYDKRDLGGIQSLCGQDEGGGRIQKMSVFVHAQGTKTVNARDRVKNGKILST